MNPSRYSPRLLAHPSLIAAATLLMALSPAPTRGQSQAAEDLGGCTLKDHVYHCDGAVFQKALAAATAVKIETHNADGIARSQLGDFVSKKLGKTIAAPGASADLDFLMIPVDDQGVMYSEGSDANLGTLRIYTATPDGARGHLLWAETFSGRPNMPWPAVVHGLILQFQARFKIK